MPDQSLDPSLHRVVGPPRSGPGVVRTGENGKPDSSWAQRQPAKDEAISADFPEVRIDATAMTPHLNADSSNTRVAAARDPPGQR